MLKNILSVVVSLFASTMRFLFGKFSWTTPPWINYCCAKATVKPRVSLAVGMGFILSFCLILYSYHWYSSRPQPERITAKITAPAITPVAEVLTPDVLTFDFGLKSEYEFIERSVAHLDLVGKEVTNGVTTTPAVAGKWLWKSDSQLVFTPAQDWPAGKKYTVAFTKDFFAKGLNMASWSYSFSTQPFAASIDKFRLYVDPVNPRVRQAIATINFNYPVDANSLENKIALQWLALKKDDDGVNSTRLKVTINYDENKRTAYLRSDPISLPEMERTLTLTLADGIKSVSGASETLEPLHDKILIPDSSSYFKVSAIETAIVRNQKDIPEQILTVETSLGLKQAELDQSLHAYVLPKDYPATVSEEARKDYNWSVPGEVTPAVLALSTKLDLTSIPADRDYATLHSYRYHTATPAYIYVRMEKGTRGFGDFVLTKPYKTILKAPDYPREIAFMHKGALLALGTEEKISVLVRGLPAVKFNIARVLPDDVNHLVTQTGGDFSNPYFTDYNFSQDNISDVFTSVQQFDISDPSKQQYTSLDLGKYISNKSNQDGPLGLFLLNAQGWDVKSKTTLDAQDKRLILITDLGLIVKDNHDGTHDMFVQSITKGKPVENIDVSILGKNGAPIFTRKTDAQGRASFPSLVSFSHEREPTVFVARHQNDVSFLPYDRSDRKLNFSRFDIGGLYTGDNSQSALTAYVFSDRGIYRPGDVAHIGMIIKQPYVLPQPAGLPLEATVLDPRGTVIKTEKITLNESGYITFDFKTNATSVTGGYSVNLYIVKDKYRSNLIGSATVNIAEFLPDRMKMTANLSEVKKGWLSPSALKEKVGLWNLYGAPAADHIVTAKILLSPRTVSFTEYPDYTFIDPLLNEHAKPKVFTDTLTETRTDAEGQAEFGINLDQYEKATYQLTVFTEGFEAKGGRSVTAKTTALVSPLEFLVGYKADGALDYLKQGGVRSVHFIAINSDLQQQAISNLKLRVYHLHPVTSLVKNEDGTYEYKSITQSTEVSSHAFAISDKGADYALPANDIGDYLVAIVDEKDEELSRFKYSVMGTSQNPLSKNAELSVKLNKTEFAPNEDIEMQITAPYVGAGLITIERDKVYASQWFTTSTTSSVQKIHIPDGFKGNGYINIAFVRDLNSPEIFMSPLSYSVMPFSVTHQNQAIKVDLTMPALTRPGETFTIDYKTDKPGKIIVFAVDEGILQVAGYASPDPLKFFFQKHALEVGTSQIVDQILPKFLADRELSTVGGDDGEDMRKMNLNPFKRKTEAPVVYWSGIIDSDETVHQLTYQIPDYFNGTLRVMAVAVAADAVGAASKKAEVRGHFVISPNVPTFVAPGDEFVVTSSIANNVEGSGNNAEVNVKLNVSPQLSIIGSSESRVVIPEGHEGSVHFKVRANSVLGSADLTFVALLGDQSSKLSSALSVRPAVAYATSVTSGSSRDSTKSLPLNRELYPEFRNVEVAASSSPLILVAGLQRYLDDYPHGCTEQLVSKALPWLVMSKQSWLTANSPSTQEKIDKTIQMLSQRQMSSGGFSYWPGVMSARDDDFSSLYAMNFLMEARLQGFRVPAGVYSAGIGYLREVAAGGATSLSDARRVAYAIYLLTRNEIVTTNYLTNLQLTLDNQKTYAWKDDITSAYLAATYQMLKSSDEANKLISYYKPQAVHGDDGYDFYDANIGDAQYLYLLARHFPDRLQRVENKLIMSLVDVLNDNNISTVLAGYSALALSAYGEYASIRHDGQLSVSETLKDGRVNPLSTSNAEYQKVNIDAAAQQVDFNNPSKSEYFYQLVQAGFDKGLPKTAVSNGIEVFREFTHADNSPVTDVKLGEEIVVHIRTRAMDKEYYSNIALVDLLPGGFEVVRSSVVVSGMDYVDVREDRVSFFGNVGSSSKEIVYRIKATNVGIFMVPPVAGMSMYDPMVRAVGIGGAIRVN